jgi:hypothetical protein
MNSSAFRGCASLSSIWIPSSVDRVCEYCFCGCRSLSPVAFEPGSKTAHRFHQNVNRLIPPSAEKLTEFVNVVHFRVESFDCQLRTEVWPVWVLTVLSSETVRRFRQFAFHRQSRKSIPSVFVGAGFFPQSYSSPV